jgi:hypothetical protein
MQIVKQRLQSLVLPKLCCLLAADCSNNGFEGNIGPLPRNIWVFDASTNKLTGPVPDLSVYQRLSIFVASGNALRGAVPSESPSQQVQHC